MEASQVAREQSTANVYTDPDLRFAITIPHGWLVDLSGQQGTRIILFKSSAAGFRPNVNLVVHELGAMTREEYITLSRLQIKQLSGHPKMDVDQPATHQEGGHIIEWHGRMGPFHLKLRQLIVFRGPLAFLVSATGPYTEFAEYRKDFETAMDSFCFQDDGNISSLPKAAQ